MRIKSTTLKPLACGYEHLKYIMLVFNTISSIAELLLAANIMQAFLDNVMFN